MRRFAEMVRHEFGVMGQEFTEDLPVLWYIVAALLIVWGALYLWIQGTRQPLTVLWFLAGFAFVLWLMFFGEGTEIAYTILIDKDPDQVPEHLREPFAKLLASEHVRFISGRQILVVFAIVGMTWLCEVLSDVGDPALAIPSQLAIVTWRDLRYLTDDSALASPSQQALATLWELRHLFSVLFPAFFAFWFAQLPSKLIAHENALMAFRWFPIRWAITWSIFLGERLRVEGPSPQVKDLLVRWLRRRDDDVLKPSRAFYYKTSAMLRDGKGVEEIHVRMWIENNGATHVEETITIHAYAPGVNKVGETVMSEAAFKPGATLDVVVAPPLRAAQSGPNDDGKIMVGAATYYQMSWHATLPRNLPIGKDLVAHVKYGNGPGAMHHTVPQTDDYEYRVKYVPTKKLIVDVMVRPNTGFMLIDQTVKATTSENADVNAEEARRVVRSEVVDDESVGFRYAVDYPLLNTTFVFGWTLGQNPIALPPAVLP